MKVLFAICIFFIINSANGQIFHTYSSIKQFVDKDNVYIRNIWKDKYMNVSMYSSGVFSSNWIICPKCYGLIDFSVNSENYEFTKIVFKFDSTCFEYYIKDLDARSNFNYTVVRPIAIDFGYLAIKPKNSSLNNWRDSISKTIIKYSQLKGWETFNNLFKLCSDSTISSEKWELVEKSFNFAITFFERGQVSILKDLYESLEMYISDFTSIQKLSSQIDIRKFYNYQFEGGYFGSKYKIKSNSDSLSYINSDIVTSFNLRFSKIFVGKATLPVWYYSAEFNKGNIATSKDSSKLKNTPFKINNAISLNSFGLRFGVNLQQPFGEYGITAGYFIEGGIQSIFKNSYSYNSLVGYSDIKLVDRNEFYSLNSCIAVGGFIGLKLMYIKLAFQRFSYPLNIRSEDNLKHFRYSNSLFLNISIPIIRKTVFTYK